MKKFFLMTRGRTGSTAVLDHLERSASISATQELFANWEFKNRKVWGDYLPFEIWKKDTWMRRVILAINGERWLGHMYLSETESLASKSGAKGFGFKLLSNHFDEKTYLLDLLRKRKYKAIYLTRNAPRQVLSGMVAAQSGMYNSRKPKYENTNRYPIDLEQFRAMVSWEVFSAEKDREWLVKAGFEYREVTYEDFCEDKQAFFAGIFDFLGLPPENLDETDFKVMIKDVAHTVENYDEVVECVRSMGLELKA